MSQFWAQLLVAATIETRAIRGEIGIKDKRTAAIRILGTLFLGSQIVNRPLTSSFRRLDLRVAQRVKHLAQVPTGPLLS